ncbi:MAG: hypothetical protein AMR96_02465 [Candidatus Adiutrix intracellularis]|jgi:hypothetical protein|nr:MAG: hypothetical protein AMR96_02465 [Candidatus Adiutrix intracellularis]
MLFFLLFKYPARLNLFFYQLTFIEISLFCSQLLRFGWPLMSSYNPVGPGAVLRFIAAKFSFGEIQGVFYK